MDLQLASKSPRRAELLTQIGVAFGLVGGEVDERRHEGEAPDAYVQRLAREKARAGFAGSPVLPTLGADTIVCCGACVFGKPKNKEDALRMLNALSGRSHTVMTAVAVFDGNREQVALVETKVRFRKISPDEMNAYWETGEPKDKAGSYAIQGKAAIFVEAIEGDYSAVVGLPLLTTANLLSTFMVPIWAGALQGR